MLCDLELSSKLEKASDLLIYRSTGQQVPAPPKSCLSSVSPGLTLTLPILPLESKTPLKALPGQSCSLWELIPHPADSLIPVDLVT